MSLREDLPRQVVKLFDAACEQLGEICGGRERVVWQGDCWKWTLGYSPRRKHPVAVVIPNPEDFQIAMRVDPGFVSSVWELRLKRPVRDGLGLAGDPFDTEWGVWTITSLPVLEEVLGLVRRNLDYLGGTAG